MARWPEDINDEVMGRTPEARVRVTKEQRLAVRVEAERRRSIAAIMFMTFGATMASIGAGFQWGWPISLLIIGVMFFINGLLIGM